MVREPVYYLAFQVMVLLNKDNFTDVLETGHFFLFSFLLVVVLIYLNNDQFLFVEKLMHLFVDLIVVEEVYSILKMCFLVLDPIKSNLKLLITFDSVFCYKPKEHHIKAF